MNCTILEKQWHKIYLRDETQMDKILIVEDDWDLNHGIAQRLLKEGYMTFCAYSISEAKQNLLQKTEQETGDFSLVLLDVNLPDGEGFSLLPWMKKYKKDSIPVIFLTARDLEEDALTGYELGAVDYVTKPFSVNVLIKKIGVILNRTKEEISTDFDDGYLTVCLKQGKVCVQGELCAVTPTEFRILSAFLSAKNQLLTYEMLLEKMWDGGNQFVDKHALAVNIGRLRGKIENDTHKYIANVYGMGYQWTAG